MSALARFVAIDNAAFMLYLLLSVALAANPAPASTWQPPAVPACSDIALLVNYDYSYVQANICQLCGAANPSACEYDWPTNDVPQCSYFDQLRNGIYAYYGRPFESEKWKAYFAKQTWYRVNPAYTDALLSPAAKRNVALLKDMADKGERCSK
jgi:hypothetical protein